MQPDTDSDIKIISGSNFIFLSIYLIDYFKNNLNDKVQGLIFANGRVLMKSVIFSLLSFFIIENSFSQGSLRSEYERGFDINKEITQSTSELLRKHAVDEVFICTQDGILNLYTLAIGFKRSKVYFKTIGEIINEDNFSVSDVSEKNKILTWRECTILDCNQFGTTYEFHREGTNKGKLYSRSKMGDMKNTERFNCTNKKNEKQTSNKKNIFFEDKEGQKHTFFVENAVKTPKSGLWKVDYLISNFTDNENYKSLMSKLEINCSETSSQQTVKLLQVEIFRDDERTDLFLILKDDGSPKFQSLAESIKIFVPTICLKLN